VESLIVVDAANVVGSVPDGWWRDRAGATERLRDALAARSPQTLPGEVVLVVEGAARGVASIDGVRVVAADGSGDDAIVHLVRDRAAGRESIVVSADRGLGERVRALGATVVGPSAVPRRPSAIPRRPSVDLSADPSAGPSAVSRSSAERPDPESAG
jgi:hypothetical protein